MLCNSTFLYDKQTNVSPKLEEFAELMREQVAAGTHKVVVFSQWEVMLHKAAEVLDRLQIGYVLLYGGVPGKERRGLLERFRTDPDCRVFLSTDTGGTGLNLQAADTVLNLELPWNPAVLEQRIARVHRMGQHRPVQVINLVTRDSIEERVLKTVSLKRSLFEGVFAGTADEVSFATLGQQAFLDAVRGLIAEGGAESPSTQYTVPGTPQAGPDPRQALVQAGVQFLEALAGMLGSASPAANGNGVPPLLAPFVATDPRTGQEVIQLPLPPPEVLQRGAAALQTIVAALGGRPSPTKDVG
jgi:hypothetical protein